MKIIKRYEKCCNKSKSRFFESKIVSTLMLKLNQKFKGFMNIKKNFNTINPSQN